MSALDYSAGLCVIALFSTLAAGCAPVVVAGGAGAVSAAYQERGFKGTIKDTVIRADINRLWLGHADGQAFLSTTLSVIEGRVLLAGQVKEPRTRVDAVRLAWQAAGVREVINEIRIAEHRSISDYSRDAWITTTLRVRILLDKEVASVNYSIDTVGKIVYLMGIAQSTVELERVKAHAREVSYVKRVISYVVLKNDPKRKGLRLQDRRWG